MTPSRPAPDRASGQATGLLFAGACAAVGAFVAPVARLTTGHGDVLFVAVATTLLAGITALAVLGVRGRLGRLFERGRVPGFLLLGALGTAVPSLLFFLGAARTSAIDTVLCLQTEPAYSLALAWLVLGHRLSLRRVASVGVILFGVALAVSGPSAADPLGLALLLATPLAWQLSHLFVLRRLTDTSPEILTGARYVYGGLVLGSAGVLLAGRGLVPAVDSLGDRLPALVVQGVVLSYVGTTLWYQAIARLDLARSTAIVVPSIPLLSLAASWILVGEVPTARQLAGMLLAASGVLSFVLAPHAVEVRERVPTATAPLGAAADPDSGSDEA